ncbi:uncharacterized protein MYCFIDRAFT_206884 [Pseudocercospora fijiensis CIRAD86]|uniref:Uncharacterized protein n=1 Tax=Pseudocercospora fijiensis (strain CIRAD86) TaxID=383855 RepID=M3BBF5_PSEFD|nr:uncharacterized protein MYCFIDRAFT_206884 [Pseudocercospora fijiensis CIRAD86]EME86627.1 hypothetical protein MYCFIDRAFT_206884 [Pseudocercospora fijiensis CIRAD86]
MRDNPAGYECALLGLGILCLTYGIPIFPRLASDAFWQNARKMIILLGMSDHGIIKLSGCYIGGLLEEWKMQWTSDVLDKCSESAFYDAADSSTITRAWEFRSAFEAHVERWMKYFCLRRDRIKFGFGMLMLWEIRLCSMGGRRVSFRIRRSFDAGTSWTFETSHFRSFQLGMLSIQTHSKAPPPMKLHLAVQMAFVLYIHVPIPTFLIY